MASREEDRDRRIRKITSKDIEPGRELQEVTQAQNEISGINSELQNNLAMEQSEALARNNNNNILRQAAEIGLMGAAGGAIVQQVGNFNPTTQELLQKYGIKPGPPVNKVETKTTNQNFRSNTGGNTRIENTTNNTTNSRTDIKIVQPQIPMQQRQIAVSSQQAGPDANTTRFKTWLSGVFAKQQNDYEVQKKEYRKREWNLNRSANRMMRRIETATKTFSEKMDPRNMGSSLSGQLKTLLFLFGTYMISKVWKPTMEIVANIETGFRSAFGLPINGDLAKSGAKTLSIIDSIKKFIGIDINTKEGRNTNLIEGIGKIFTQGIDRLIARIDLFLKDRQIAIKSVKFPKIDVPDIKLPGFGSLMDGIKDTMGSISQYLGNLMSAAFGGSSGLVSTASNTVRKTGKSELQDKTRSGVKRQIGDRGLMEGNGREYMRKSDFDTFGNLKSDASSTMAMSQTITSMMNDKTGKVYTGAVATGLENLENVASRTGQVVIDPNLLLQLGLKPEDISRLQTTRKLKPVQYKFVKGKPEKDELEDDSIYSGLGGVQSVNNRIKWAKATGEFLTGGIVKGSIDALNTLGTGEVIDTSLDYIKGKRGETIENNYLKLVPINEPGEQVGDIKTLYSLTKEGFNDLKTKLGTKDFDLKNKDFVDWVTKTLKAKKIENRVNKPLILDQDFGEYNAAQSRLGQYNQEIKNLSDEKLHPEWGESIRAGRNVSNLISNFGKWGGDLLNYSAKKVRNIAGADFKSKKDFVEKMKSGYERVLIERGFNPNFARFLVAQDAIESGWGKKISGDFNFGGIKVDSKDKGKGLGSLVNTTEFDKKTGTYIPIVDEFRNFKNLDEYLNYKVSFLDRKRYKAFDGNPDEFIYRVVSGGYATDPEYGDKLANTWKTVANIEATDYKKGQEKDVLHKITNTVADVLDKAGNFLSGGNESNLVSQQSENLKNSQIDFRNKFFQDMYGAKIDESGVYIDNGDSRVYLNPSSTSLKLDESSISSVVKVNKNGTIEPGDIGGSERDRIVSDTISNIQDMLISYEGKGTDQDYLSENGKPKWIYLGKFGDTKNFSPEARLIYRNIGGIDYSILFSKDGKRVVRIKTTSIDYPWTINKRHVKTGEYLYWTNHFKTPLGKVVSWNPLFTNLGVKLTPLAQIALDKLKKIVGTDYKKLDDILDKDFRSTVDNKNLAIRSGMVDENGNITSLKASLVDFKQNFNESGFFKALGINKIEELQSRVESNPQEFYTDSDGKVYHKISGLLVGQMKGDKFTAESIKNIQNWIKTNPGAMDQIRDKILRETRSNELALKGEIGYDKLLGVTTQIFSGIKDLGFDSHNYNKWLDGNNNIQASKNIIQNIGGYKFIVKLSKDGSKAEAIKPILKIGDDERYHLVTQTGLLGENGIDPDYAKQLQWVSIEDFKKNPKIFSFLLPDSFDSNNITSQIDSVNWDLNKLINLGDMNVPFYDRDKNEILELNNRIKKEYLSNNILGNDEEIQRLIKISRNKYLSGDTNGFISGEDGKMFTKEGILFGKLGKDGSLGEVSNSDVFTELEKNLEFSKPELYKKWFGAKEDGNELVIEKGDSRIVLDLSKPLTKDWTKIIKDVQWRENSQGTWEKVTNGSAGSTVGNWFGFGNSEEENKSKIIKDIKGLVDKRAADPEWAELIEKNNGNVEEAMKELSKAEYENQDIQKQQLDNLQTQTKSMLDIQSLVAATAEKSGVNLDTVEFTLSGDTLATSLGNKTALEGRIKAQKAAEEKRKQEEKEKAQESAMEGKSPLGPQIFDNSTYAPQQKKVIIQQFGAYFSPDAQAISDTNKT